MFLLIVIPRDCPVEDYEPIPVVSVVRYSRLIRYEDELKKLSGGVLRFLGDVLRKYQKISTTSVSIQGTVREFCWNDLIRRNMVIEDAIWAHCATFTAMQSMQQAADQSYSQNIAWYNDLLKRETDDIFEAETGKNEEYRFIECAYVTVQKEAEKNFKKELLRILGLEYAVQIKSEPNHLIYKIYYLKKDSDKIFDQINRNFVCKRIGISKNTQINRKTSQINLNNSPRVLTTDAGCCATDDGQIDTNGGGVAGPKNCDTKINKITHMLEIKNEHAAFLYGKILEAAKLHVNTCFFMAYVESLHRYGAPGKYKYKIIEVNEKRCAKELRKIKKVLLDSKTIEASSDDEEYPFTHVVIEDFEEK